MTLHLNAILCPQLLRDDEMLRNSITVVIDVFRATTTIAVALEHGALEIVPMGTIKDAEAKAKEMRGRLGETSVLLCGERGGMKPEGFDLGNSPLEYTREAIQGKVLVLTTTNGTRALQAASTAPLVLAASFANLQAVVKFIMRYLVLHEARTSQAIETSAAGGKTSNSESERQIESICAFCAGSEGDFSYEDTLCAGALLEALAKELSDGEYAYTRSDTATAAQNLYRCETNLAQTLASTRHAEHLTSLGFRADVEFASTFGTSRMIPLRRADGSLIHWHNPLSF